jgi:hypothetical protein
MLKVERASPPLLIVLMFVAPIVAMSLSATAAPLVSPGEYDLRTRMVMPHLDEMRRSERHQRLCMDEAATAASLFPVLEQPALRGCTLDHAQADGPDTSFVLVCASSRVASGTARLSQDGNLIEGVLEVKMGGKNMTFAQYVAAVRVGGCH